MNKIEQECEYYLRQLAKVVDEQRSYRGGKNGVPEKLSYCTAQRPLPTADSEKRSNELKKALAEIRVWKIYDANRAAELRSRIEKGGK